MFLSNNPIFSSFLRKIELRPQKLRRHANRTYKDKPTLQSEPETFSFVLFGSKQFDNSKRRHFRLVLETYLECAESCRDCERRWSVPSTRIETNLRRIPRSSLKITQRNIISQSFKKLRDMISEPFACRPQSSKFILL